MEDSAFSSRRGPDRGMGKFEVSPPSPQTSRDLPTCEPVGRSRLCTAVITLAATASVSLGGQSSVQVGALTQPLRTPSQAIIGLLLTPEDATERELYRGAELAVREYAASTGGQAISLELAAVAGQWNAGAGELVRLVYDRGAKAVLGPARGRPAHLAEQVTARAKGRFLLLTPWATDPTLTQIKVPWFFRLAHDDLLQVEALLKEICSTQGLRKVIVVVDEADYDSRQAAEALERVARAYTNRETNKLLLRRFAAVHRPLIAQIRSFAPDAVLFMAPPGAALSCARSLRQAGIRAPFFGPLALSSPGFLEAGGDVADGMVLAAPPESSGSVGERFRAGYRRLYGQDPGTPAAYGYDGAMVLIEAFHSAGAAGGEPLRAALAATYRDGLTGRIEFNASGNRRGPAPLARVERARLRPLGRDVSLRP